MVIDALRSKNLLTKQKKSPQIIKMIITIILKGKVAVKSLYRFSITPPRDRSCIIAVFLISKICSAKNILLLNFLRFFSRFQNWFIPYYVEISLFELIIAKILISQDKNLSLHIRDCDLKY